MNQQHQDYVASPCVGICHLDQQDVCIGCYRSALEIIQWSTLSSEEKKQVLANTEIRQQQRLRPDPL